MKIRDILENFILAAIVLVIIHTFLFELAAYMHWSISTRNALIVSGLFFDFLFTTEFIVRSIAGARKDKKTMYQYWIYERGWVDFLSSVPLLLLDSGPSVYFLYFSGVHDGGASIGALNVLKVVKAVRVTRILRLVRIIKIFGKIHNAESKMAQHHTASISTTAVFTIIIALMGFTLFTDSSGLDKIEERKAYYSNILEASKYLRVKNGKGSYDAARRFLEKDRRILSLHKNDRKLISRFEEEKFAAYYNVHDDYVTVQEGDYRADISIVDIHKDIALQHIESFIIIVGVVLSFMIIYTRHFVQTISDIVHILNKGFRKKDYNLQIKIRDEFADEEIFRLAKFYNNAYLPAKLKRLQSENENKDSGLTMNDLLDFNK